MSQNKAPSPLQHFLAGVCGGTFGLCLAYPLDTVKVRMQTRPPGTYTSIANCLATITKNEGFFALYRGLISPVVGYGLINATVFGVNGVVKDTMKSSPSWNNGKVDMSRDFSVAELSLSGAIAGFVQSFVRAPIEQIKVVMQARNKAGSSNLPPYKSTGACLVDVIKTEGIKVGLYRSLIPTISREIPQYALYYPIYEISKRLMGIANGDKPLNNFHTAIAGGLAGVGQWLPTYPVDVIKSKVAAAVPGTYNGFIDCGMKIYQQEGVAVFFRGLSASLVRAFPLHGAVFVGYETAMKFLRE